MTKRTIVKKGIKDIISTLILLFLFSNLISYLRRPQLNSATLPSLQQSLLDQSSFNSNHLKKQPFIIYFWATWCSVCSFQSPVIDSISKESQVLSIAVKSGTDLRLKTYVEQNQYKFPILNDSEGNWSTHFKISHFPTILIYNSQGELSFSDVGYTSYWGLKLRLFLTEFGFN